MDSARFDWGALEGWLITAVLLALIVGLVWYRRWRRDAAGFRESWKRMPADHRLPGDRFRPPPR